MSSGSAAIGGGRLICDENGSRAVAMPTGMRTVKLGRPSTPRDACGNVDLGGQATDEGQQQMDIGRRAVSRRYLLVACRAGGEERDPFRNEPARHSEQESREKRGARSPARRRRVTAASRLRVQRQRRPARAEFLTSCTLSSSDRACTSAGHVFPLRSGHRRSIAACMANGPLTEGRIACRGALADPAPGFAMRMLRLQNR